MPSATSRTPRCFSARKEAFITRYLSQLERVLRFKTRTNNTFKPNCTEIFINLFNTNQILRNIYASWLVILNADINSLKFLWFEKWTLFCFKLPEAKFHRSYLTINLYLVTFSYNYLPSIHYVLNIKMTLIWKYFFSKTHFSPSTPGRSQSGRKRKRRKEALSQVKHFVDNLSFIVLKISQMSTHLPY